MGQFFDPYYLILYINNCLYLSMYAFYQVLVHLWQYFIPTFLYTLPQLMHSFRWCQRYSIGFRSGDCAGHLSTWMLLSEKYCVSCWNVFLGVIVLLKVLLTLRHIQIFKAFHHSLPKYYSVYIFTWTPISNLTSFHLIPPHTTPHHKVVTPSIFNNWYCSLVW